MLRVSTQAVIAPSAASGRYRLPLAPGRSLGPLQRRQIVAAKSTEGGKGPGEQRGSRASECMHKWLLQCPGEASAWALQPQGLLTDAQLAWPGPRV